MLNPRAAQIDCKLDAMKRMPPRSHLGIDGVRAMARADACDVRVIINEPRRINVSECAFGEIAPLRAQPVFQLFRPVRECSADMFQQTHDATSSDGFTLLNNLERAH